MGSSQTGDLRGVPCVARQALHPWTNREAHSPSLHQLPYLAVLVLPAVRLLCVWYLKSRVEARFSLEAVPALQMTLSGFQFPSVALSALLLASVRLMGEARPAGYTYRPPQCIHHSS